ncbi:MAG: hypothetical protein WA077_12760, partial [Anaerolineae bacterium]
ALGGAVGGSLAFSLILGAVGLIVAQAPPLWLVSSLGLALLLGVGLASGNFRLRIITALAAGAAGMILANRFGLALDFLDLEAGLTGAVIGASLAWALGAFSKD